jgi:hypothetical protein
MKDFAGPVRGKLAEDIERGGWDKMPGQETAGGSVSQGCVTGSEALVKKWSN